MIQTCGECPRIDFFLNLQGQIWIQILTVNSKVFFLVTFKQSMNSTINNSDFEMAAKSKDQIRQTHPFRLYLLNVVADWSTVESKTRFR